MIRNIPLGIFSPGSSFLHRLQARTKLLVIVLFVVSLVIANQRQWHFAPYIIALAFMMSGLFLSGISLRDLWKRLWLLLGITFTSALFSIFSNDDQSVVLVQIGPLKPPYALLYTIALVVVAGGLVALVSIYIPGLRNIWHSRVMKIVRLLIMVLLFAALLFIWLTAGTPLQQALVIGPLVISERGAWIFVTVFTMFVVLYLSSLLLTMTTMPVALIEGLTMLLSPLRRLKLPVDDFALMTLLALRFIPTLLDEAGQLMNAQAARGSDILHGTIQERLQSLVMFFQPLIQGSLRRASELATALEARGYQNDGKRTMMHETRLRAADYFVLLVVAVGMIGSLLV
jgi:energy-coupling factor transport system permease protein